MKELSKKHLSFLENLKKIKGFDGFFKSGEERDFDKDFLVELEGLHFIHEGKITGIKLLEISSSGNNEPEGIFHSETHNKEGIIECWRRDFDPPQNQENKITNSLENIFNNQPFLNGKILSVNIMNYNIDEPGIIQARGLLKRDIQDGEWNYKYHHLPEIIFHIGETQYIHPEAKFAYFIQQTGKIKLFNNKEGVIDLIKNQIKSKREQHKEKYEDYLKLYYFRFDYPPTLLMKIKKEEGGTISKKLNDKEGLVLNTSYEFFDIYKALSLSTSPSSPPPQANSLFVRYR